MLDVLKAFHEASIDAPTTKVVAAGSGSPRGPVRALPVGRIRRWQGVRAAKSTAQLSPDEITRRVHIVGAGPVGLLLTALLQSMDGFSVRLYEKRHEYTRTRMVQLAPYLVADSVESYRTDSIDGDSVEAVFDPPELDEGLAFRQSIPAGPDGAASRLGAGVLPAQRHRAVASAT